MVKLFVLLVAIFGVCFVQGQPLQKQKLRFKVSGRDLPDKDNFGKTDPYVEIFYTEEGSTKQTKVGRSETITDTVNPNWGNVFEFNYDRTKGQRFYLKVYDHDNAREDDTVGRTWVILDDFVDRGQKYTTNLDRKGILTLETVDPTSVRAAVIQPLVQKEKLKFRISGNNLPDKDNIGVTDPYVELYYTENGSDKRTSFGRTDTIDDTVNPNWSNTFEFDYDRSKGQRWYFKVYDHDIAREDDTVGRAWVIVDDYVDRGQKYTVNLHKQGTLTLTSLNPMTPPTVVASTTQRA